MTYMEMNLALISFILDQTAYSTEKDYAMIAMKLLISILENEYGKVDSYLSHFVDICTKELQNLNQKYYKHYQSTILQAICMCFWYNASLTFTILEQKGQTNLVFMRLLTVIDKMSHNFEVRRVIFGLTSIVGGDHNSLPQVVY